MEPFMAKKESIQKKLQKVRPPRVQLTYDVEKGDAIEQKELPFVVGVVGDFSAQSQADLPRLRDRKFVNVDRDNFDDVMSGLQPRAAFKVGNKLSSAGGQFGVDLTFESIDDFRPESVVQKVDPLRELVELRTKLADLRNKMAGNDKLEDVLSEVLANTEKLKALQAEAGSKEAADE
jgi:type VI secretion system protein ImpB